VRPQAPTTVAIEISAMRGTPRLYVEPCAASRS
jgi:hypothetical protein